MEAQWETVPATAPSSLVFMLTFVGYIVFRGKITDETYG